MTFKQPINIEYESTTFTANIFKNIQTETIRLSFYNYLIFRD